MKRPAPNRRNFQNKRPGKFIRSKKLNAKEIIKKRRESVRNTLKKGSNLVHRIKNSKIFKFSLKKFLIRKKEIFKKWLLSFEFIRYFWFKKEDSKKFNQFVSDKSKKTADTIIEGIGGAKNLMSVKKTVYHLQLNLKSDYLVNPELIKTAAGILAKVEEKKVSMILERSENISISKEIKNQMNIARSKYILSEAS